MHRSLRKCIFRIVSRSQVDEICLFAHSELWISLTFRDLKQPIQLNVLKKPFLAASLAERNNFEGPVLGCTNQKGSNFSSESFLTRRDLSPGAFKTVGNSVFPRDQ